MIYGVLASEVWQEAWQPPPPGNQEPLMVKGKDGRPTGKLLGEQVREMW